MFFDLHTAVFKECTIQSPLTVIPYMTPGDVDAPSYNFHGTCEHVLSSPCDSDAYKVVGDFLQTDLNTGRVGLLLPGYSAIIDENLNLIAQGEQPTEVTTEQSDDRVSITLSDSSNFVVSIVRTVDKIVIMSVVGSGELCGLCGSKDGCLVWSTGKKVTDIMDRMQIEGFAASWRVEPSEQILHEDRRECGKSTHLETITRYSLN